MKKISYFWNKIIDSIFACISIILALILILFCTYPLSIIFSWIINDNQEIGLTAVYFNTMLVLIIINLAIYIATHTPSLLIKIILECDNDEDLANYPIFYHLAYLNPQAQSHQQILKAIPTHKKAYMVGIIFTYNEIRQMFDYMKANRSKYYEVPKGFLLPDGVSALQPRIFLRDAREIFSQMRVGQSVVLVYTFYHPRQSQIRRHDEVILITAHLN